MRANYTKKTVFLVVCTFLLLVSTALPSLYEKERQSEITAEETAAAGTSYTLSEFNGKLAVFKNGETEPIEVYDVFIENLPEQDRQLLVAKSLTTTSKKQLLLWIEDYIG